MPAKSRFPAPQPSPTIVDVAVTGDVDARVLRQFRLVFNTVKAHFRQVEKKTSLGGAQLWALSLIRGEAGMGVGDLARGMDIHQSTASNLVKSLVERELVTTARSENDGRAVRLRITAAGSRLLRRAPGPPEGVLPAALGALDVAALRNLERGLAALIVAIGADDRGKSIPLGHHR